MTDEHRIGSRRIERAVGLVGDLKRCKLNASIELERLIETKPRDLRMRFSASLRRSRKSGFSRTSAIHGPYRGTSGRRTHIARKRKPLTCQRTGLDRAASRGVNVFFAFAKRASYQCVGSNIGYGASQYGDRRSCTFPARAASRDRSHRRRHARAADAAWRHYRSPHQSETDRRVGVSVPPCPRGRHDAAPGGAPSRDPAA